MGRTAGAKNKPKDETTPKTAAPKTPKAPKGPTVANAVPGHNSRAGELTDEQRKALEFEHMKTIKEKKTLMNSARSHYQNARKAAKADKCRLSRIDNMLLMDSPGGEASLRQAMSDIRDAFEWKGVAVGDQIDLFPVDRRPDVDRAYAAGKVAGLEGRDRRSPHDPSVPQNNAWLDGYDAGQEANREMMGRMNTPQPTEVDEAEFVRGEQPELNDDLAPATTH